MRVSVVAPFYNEVDGIPSLAEKLANKPQPAGVLLSSQVVRTSHVNMRF